MMAAVKYCGDVDVICDIGGQDIKVLFMVNGEIRNFRLSNQCSAGNGMLLQAMANQFGLPVTEYADAAFQAALSPKFSYGCAVFLDADRVNFQKEGYSKEELLAGLAMVLPKNVWQYVVQIPRLAQLGHALRAAGRHAVQPRGRQGAGGLHQGRACPVRACSVHPHPGEAGAIGAALETLRVVKRRGRSTFIGLDAAIDLALHDRSTTRRRRVTSVRTSARARSSTPRRRMAAPAATSRASAARRARSNRSTPCARSRRSARR